MKNVTSDDMGKMKAVSNIVYYRVITYCKGVAKDSDEFNRFLNDELIIKCHKIAAAIIYYETENNLKYSTSEIILITDDVINYSEFNLFEMPNDVVQKVSKFVCLGVDESVRFITGRVFGLSPEKGGL
jgi:hypothetical protein